MGKVMKSDATSADAYARFNLPVGQTDVWFTARMAFPGASLTFFFANGTGALVSLKEGGGANAAYNMIDTDSLWHLHPGADLTGSIHSPSGDAWMLVEMQLQSDGTTKLYVDGTLEDTHVSSDTSPLVARLYIGQFAVGVTDPLAVVYYDDVKLGTTRGGTDLFSDDFESGTFAAWSTTSGAVSIVDDPYPAGTDTLSSPEGVCVSFDSPSLEPEPLWTRLDDPAASWRLRVARVEIDRGAGDNEVVKTGTASITFKDPDGVLDPTNTSSPFFGVLNPNLQAAVARWNPVTETWFTRFRGFVSAIRHTMDTSGFSEVTMELVDAFDLFADLTMTPGAQGDTPPPESIGDIYYAGGSPIPALNTFKHVDQRLVQVLDDIGWPGTGTTLSTLRDIFSGNVTVQAEVYERDGQAVEVITDAADAEFPDVSRVFMSKEGVFTFRGRFARFFPEHPGYGIGSWSLGGSAEAEADNTVVLLQSFSFQRAKEDIINVATALPKGLTDADVPGQVVTDATSITAYGRRPWTADNLLTWQGHDDVGATIDAAPETLKFAQFKVDNFKDPKTRVLQVVVTFRHPDAFSGVAAWAFLCGVELGDLAHVATTHRGGGGFDEDYFIEALREIEEPFDGRYHKVTIEADLSPRSFYSSNPFGTVDSGLS